MGAKKAETNKKVRHLYLTSDYYIIFMNPTKHKKDWNALRLIMQVTEIKYCVFLDERLYSIEIHPVDKHEFESYNYNPN